MSSAKVLPVRGEGEHGSGADSVLESGESRAARASERGQGPSGEGEERGATVFVADLGLVQVLSSVAVVCPRTL